MNARYYAGVAGKFVSVDPVFLDVGGDLGGYGKKIQEILVNPQGMNSYSYVSNRPLVLIDPMGESEWYAWAFNPVGTARQVTCWKGVSSGYLRGWKGWDISADFLDHSLKLNPKDMNISANNDSRGIISAIKDNGDYQKFILETVSKYGVDGKLNVTLLGKESVNFKGENDLHYSIAGTESTIIKGGQNEDGSWSVNVNVNDTYNFHPKISNQDYQDIKSTTANNIGYMSQESGVISNYGVSVSFSDNVD